MATKKQKKDAETFGSLITLDASGQLGVANSAASLIDRIHAVDESGNPIVDDDSLVDLFRSTVMAEAAAFVVRGAAAYELVDRMERQGATFTTQKDQGMDALFTDIVRRTNVKKATIMEDFRIYRHHHQDMITTLSAAPDALLPREFYRLANQVESTTWVTPQEMADYFREMRDSFLYTSDHARRDVKLVNKGMTIDEVRQADADVRADAIAGKKNKKGLRQRPQQMLVLRIAKNTRSVRLYDQIIQTHGSFEVWFDRRASEEFGDDDV